MKPLLFIAALLALAGCGPQINANFLPDKSWLEDCFIVPPPERKAMERADEVGRIELLTLNRIQQDEVLVACNKRLEKARQWREWASEQINK